MKSEYPYLGITFKKKKKFDFKFDCLNFERK